MNATTGSVDLSDFSIVAGRYRLKVTGHNYSHYDSEEEVEEKIKSLSEPIGEETEYELPECSDDEQSDDEEEEINDAGLYGNHAPNSSFFINLIDVKIKIGRNFTTLMIKFVCDDPPNFPKLNSNLNYVDMITEQGELIFHVNRKQGSDEGVWFSDMFIDQEDDQELMTYHEGKKVWALKWSKPNNLPKG